MLLQKTLKLILWVSFTIILLEYFIAASADSNGSTSSPIHPIGTDLSSSDLHIPTIAPIIVTTSVAFLVLVTLIATIFMTKRNEQKVDDSANSA
ncbi:1753_t:CDS:2 [Ambispora leptoticha]|uniref:1753_t:CDS:1 n=1 Tax=Ambispora leptoticha TaxID=144679 RepID=A0A9N8VQH8_9GLOM|nr:1753_t:CDS:2 [Ambispora leptoticha]